MSRASLLPRASLNPSSLLEDKPPPKPPKMTDWKLVATQHPDFWFHDGSIVICTDKTLFRVHQTILEKHSEVFSNLFSLPQPEGEEMVDGCRVILLHDSKQDFVDLLTAMYNPTHFDNLPSHADTSQVLTFVGGILRLSTKYLIHLFRQRCISLISSKFPTTLNAYAARFNRHSKQNYDSETIMRAAALAQESNVPEMLPFVYYCVARLSPERLLRQNLHDISWKDKTICLIGREELRQAERNLSYSFLFAFRRAATCESYLCDKVGGPHAEWDLVDAAKSPNPLKEYTTWDRLGVCSTCLAHCKELHRRGREDVWKRLPEIFELGSWDKLRRQQSRKGTLRVGLGPTPEANQNWPLARGLPGFLLGGLNRMLSRNFK